MLSDFFKVEQSSHKSIQISETVDIARVKALLSQGYKEFTLNLLNELQHISARDSYELFITIDGDDLSVSSNNKDVHESIINSHFSKHSEIDEFELELSITKQVSNSILSIYFIENFVQYLSESSTINVFKTLSGIFSNKLFFEVFSEIDAFGSKTIQFFQNGLQGLTANPFLNNRQDILDSTIANGISSNLVLNLLPSDFYLVSKSPFESLNNLFYDVCILLSLSYISNITGLSDRNEFDLKIHGYKSLFIKNFQYTSYRGSNKQIFEIYKWAYEGGASSDKLGIIRNVLSIHHDINGNLLFDNEVWDAIQSNHQIYLKSNIKNYLEVKNKIGEFLLETTSKTYLLVDSILTSLKQNLLVLVTFIVSTFLLGVVKKQSEVFQVFSLENIYILVLLIVICTLLLKMVKNDSLNRFDSAKENTRSILNANYKSILMDSEIQTLTEPVLVANEKYLRDQIKKYETSWKSIICVIVFLFLVGNFIFVHDGIASYIDRLYTYLSKSQLLSFDRKFTAR